MAGALQRAENCRISAMACVETAILNDRNRNPVLSRRLDDRLRDAQIQVESVTPPSTRQLVPYSTVTDFARFLG
jgi:uncharacterized protein with PIN domain